MPWDSVVIPLTFMSFAIGGYLALRSIGKKFDEAEEERRRLQEPAE